MKSKVIKLDRLVVVKSILVCLFLLYTLMVIDFTLINDSFGRSISNIFLSDKATVKLFINAYKDANLDTHIVIENILGNFFVMMPFALFVPNIFKKINTVLKFLICISVCVLIIEVLQIVFLTGSADIDDFVLNVGGAMLAYGVLNVARVKCTVNKFLFGERDETKG